MVEKSQRFQQSLDQTCGQQGEIEAYLTSAKLQEHLITMIWSILDTWEFFNSRHWGQHFMSVFSFFW